MIHRVGGIQKLMAGEEVPAYQEVPIKVFSTADLEAAQSYLKEITDAGNEF